MLFIDINFTTITLLMSAFVNSSPVIVVVVAPMVVGRRLLGAGTYVGVADEIETELVPMAGADIFYNEQRTVTASDWV